MNQKRCLWLVLCCLWGSATIGSAAVVGEYRVDEYTQHLWHLNEVADSNSIVDSVSGAPLDLAVVGATLGQPSAAKFGTAMLTGNSAYVDAGLHPINEFAWADGSFTFEAIIRPDVNPQSPPNHMNIICGDRAGALANRSWQFRINTDGNLEFTLLAGGVQSLVAPLPTRGPDTALAGQWYHVAVTYNGLEGEDGNLKFYWTLLNDSRNEASLLAEFNMQADLGGEPQFVIGTNGRNPSGEGFSGLIDEVRISNIERYANEMQFVARSHVKPYSPDAYTLHLWHFDDPADGNNIADAGQFTPIDMTLAGSGSLGNEAYESFGASLGTGANAFATAEYQPITEFTGVDGAFTFEGMIRPSVNPLSPPNHMNIICGDRPGGLATRAWQFRITSDGKLAFILLAGGVQDLSVPLPDAGPNAAVANQWYHVAVTYNGQEGTDGNLKLYWTLIDKGKTEANLIGEFNMQSDLGGEPRFAVGSSGRNANGEGFHGLIDEVRISSIDRFANDMLFTSEGSSKEPSFSVEPEDTLVGYGQTLKLLVLVSGAQPMTYQWMFNDEVLPGQTGEALEISDITYEQAGLYSVVATNEHGTATSRQIDVTVGAAVSELFNTGMGIDPNTGILGPWPGLTPDPHYLLIDGNDPNHLSTEALVWSDEGSPFPGYLINSDTSKWISPTSNRNNPLGRYVYRTTFLVDSTDPNQTVVEGQWTWNGRAEILLNGKSTGLGGEPVQAWRGYFPILIEEGLQAGLNTLDFIVDTNSTTGSRPPLRVEISGLGQSLPAGAPSILIDPAAKTVRDGGNTSLSVVALGRAPLSYQWLKDGQELAGATSRTLVLDPIAASDAGVYSVLVSNLDGVTASEPNTVSVINENQAPVAGTITKTVTQDQPLNISVLPLLAASSDPDGDKLYFTGVEPVSEAGGTVLDPGGAYVTYIPPAGFTGVDRITYTLEDEPFASATGTIEVTVEASH